MMWWWILIPASLEARRTVLTEHTSAVADNGRMADQTFKAVVTHDSTGNDQHEQTCCFKVVESLVFRQFEGGNLVTALENGDVHCVKANDQSEQTRAGLQALGPDHVVTLRMSTFLEVKLTELNGYTTKESTVKEQVTLLRVKTELLQKPETFQKITAIHSGFKRANKHNMMLNYGGLGTSTELACFNVETLWGHSKLSDSDKTVKMLQQGERFCICPDDQPVEVRALIDSLGVGVAVVINLVSKVVTFEENDSTELSHFMTIAEGNALQFFQATTQRGDVEVMGILNGKFCVKIVQTKSYQAFVLNREQPNDGDKICFELDLQKISVQTKLWTVEAGRTVDLTWGNEFPTGKIAGDVGVNIIDTIVVPGYTETKASGDPKTIQKITAVYQGTKMTQTAGDAKMLVNNDWTSAELECFNVTKSWGYQQITLSEVEQILPGTIFCIRANDQNEGVQTTISDLTSGDSVVMDLIHEIVVYEMTTTRRNTWKTTEPHYKVTITKGTEINFEQRSVQEATVKFHTSEQFGSDGEKYCFQIVKSKSFVEVNDAGAEKMKDDIVCFVMIVQSTANLATVLTLSQGSTIEMRWQHVWAYYENVDLGGLSTGEYVISTIEYPTEVQKEEFTRTPIHVQKMTAIYQGKQQPVGAKMFVNTAIDTSNELACFKVKTSKGYVKITATEPAELQAGDVFCFCIAEQGQAIQTIVFGLETGSIVSVNWLAELVEYSTKANKKESWRKIFVPENSFTVINGVEIESAAASIQQATLKYVSTSPALDFPREYCFTVVASSIYTPHIVTMGNTKLVKGDRLCFPLHLQTVENQMKLLGLARGTNVDTRLNYKTIFYQNENVGESTVEPVFININRPN